MTARIIAITVAAFVLGTMVGIAAADAAEPVAPQAPKCRIIYISGDAVISCPTLVVRGGK